MSSFTRSRSRYLSPLAEVLAEGETWTIGFDKMLSELAQRWDIAFEGFNEYPRSNIRKTGDNTYRIEMDVTGFTKPELKMEIIGDELVITGAKTGSTGSQAESFVHRSNPPHHFRQGFMLADYVKVTDAKLNNGVLEVDLVRDVPMNDRPQPIEIH